MQDNVSNREVFQEPFRGSQERKTRGSKWAALGVGCLFAAVGLVALVESVSNFDDFSIRARFVPRNEVSRRSGADTAPREHGFGYGLGAFLGMVFASVGVSSAAAPFLGTTGRRRLAFVVAVLWHSLGIYTCWCYVSLAPKPYDTWPLLAVGIYEWFGLIPAASAVSESALAGRLRSGVWDLWGGGFLGAVVGALVGFLAGGVWLFLPHGTGSQDGGYDWWMYGALGGGIVVGGTFLVWQLLNLGARWKAKSVCGEPSSQTAVRATVCRTCGSQIERGLSECPYCRARNESRREKRTDLGARYE